MNLIFKDYLKQWIIVTSYILLSIGLIICDGINYLIDVFFIGMLIGGYLIGIILVSIMTITLLHEVEKHNDLEDYEYELMEENKKIIKRLNEND